MTRERLNVRRGSRDGGSLQRTAPTASSEHFARTGVSADDMQTVRYALYKCLALVTLTGKCDYNPKDGQVTKCSVVSGLPQL